MAEKKINSERSKGRRHRKSEINMALFLFQASYQGNYQDLQDVLFSDKIKNEKKFLVLNARAADGMPILINCLRGSSQVKEEKDYLECIKILVSTGIALDTKDASGKTAIHWAVLLDKFEICTYLLQQGASVESSKNSILHIAISKRANNFVKLLCEYKSSEEVLLFDLYFFFSFYTYMESIVFILPNFLFRCSKKKTILDDHHCVTLY